MSQKHQEVLDLYIALGIQDVTSVKTTFSCGQINGCLFAETPSDEQFTEIQQEYTVNTEI